MVKRVLRYPGKEDDAILVMHWLIICHSIYVLLVQLGVIPFM